MPKTYLGDSVEVEVERGMLRLSTVRGGLDEHYIFLEPATYSALVAFVDRLTARWEEPKDA